MHLAWYHVGLSIMAVAALLCTSKTPRGWKWIAGISASYVISVFYVQVPKPDHMWFPLPPAITFLCDATLAAYIHKVHRERWEFWGLFVPFGVSAMISFLQNLSLLVGYPPPLPVVVYGGLLEAINAACLLLIGGIGIADIIASGRLASPHNHGSHLAKVAHVARSKTTASKARWDW